MPQSIMPADQCPPTPTPVLSTIPTSTTHPVSNTPTPFPVSLMK